MSEEKSKDGRSQIEVRKIEERYYFAYGSNMNLGQMRFRCPDAEVVGNVRLEDYRLAFRGRAPGNGVQLCFRKKEAVWMEFYGGSQKLVKRIWIFMKDFQIFMGKKPFR